MSDSEDHEISVGPKQPLDLNQISQQADKARLIPGETEGGAEANPPPSPINPAAMGTSEVDTLFRRQLQEQLEEDFSDVVIGRDDPRRGMAGSQGHFTFEPEINPEDRELARKIVDDVFDPVEGPTRQQVQEAVYGLRTAVNDFATMRPSSKSTPYPGEPDKSDQRKVGWICLMMSAQDWT